MVLSIVVHSLVEGKIHIHPFILNSNILATSHHSNAFFKFGSTVTRGTQYFGISVFGPEL
jgi:hypothetical protein